VQHRFWEAELVSRSLLPLLTGDRLTGYVHSVFRRAVNVQFDRQLISVTLPELGAMPNGIVVEGDCDFRTVGFVANTPAIILDFTLMFPKVHVTIGLSQASQWSPCLQLVQPVGPSDRSRANLARATSIAAARAPRRGFGPLLSLLAPAGHSVRTDTMAPTCAYAHARIVEVIRGIEQEDLAMAMLAAEGIVGLGDGLTPSGDDFLVGFGAALAIAGYPLATPFLESCANLASERTTYLARALLSHAAKGEYTSRLKSLLTTLLTGTERDVDRQIPIALAWGSTSGADLLLGVLVGLAVKIRQPVEVG